LLNIEQLLLRIERSQLRWFGHVSRIPQKRLPKQALFCESKKVKASWHAEKTMARPMASGYGGPWPESFGAST